jgi:gas vesicle protein
MNTGKVFLGFMAGISAGAILGILLAPGKGSSTRRKIVRRSDEYLAGLGEKFDEFIDGVSKKFDSVKEEVLSLTENGKAKAEAADNKFVANLKK